MASRAHASTNFHPDLEPFFRNDKQAEEVLKGGDYMAFIEERINTLRESIRHPVAMLLKFNANERWSASVVLNENIFRTGTYTMMLDMRQGQGELLAGQAKLQKAIEATQHMIVEYGDTSVPRMVMLIPDGVTQGQVKTKCFFGRLASEVGAVKYYNLYFLCEGCTLFPSTTCSCGSGSALNHLCELKCPAQC